MHLKKYWIDTHHCFYLLGAEVVHDCCAVILERWGITQERVHSHLGGDPDVGQVHRAGAPLRDVQQPLTCRVGLKQVSKLKKDEKYLIRIKLGCSKPHNRPPIGVH